MKVKLLSAFVVALSVPCFSATRKAEYPNYVVEFSSGSSELSQEMRKAITDFIHEVRANQVINEVYVAAWADRVRTGNKSLPTGDEELARKRGRAIANFIETDLKADTSLFNMAKRSSVLSRLFGTEESRAKDQPASRGDLVAWEIQEQGKPSAVVLVVEPK